MASGDSGVPGVFPHQLADWWERGAGAAKIRWGAAGDFDRCVRLAVEEAHMDPEGAKGFCNERHHAVLGIYPATHAKELKGRSRMATDASKPYGDVKYADPKNGKYPVDTQEHAKAAWSYINQAKNAAQYPMNGVTLSSVKDAIKAACKKFGIEISDDSDSSRFASMPFVRSFPLQDISIRGDGDGRTVDAYATVFDTPVPIHDQDGDYIEVIDRRAFDRVLPTIAPNTDRPNWRCGVFYNHGMTIHGTPSEQGSLPIGVPIEIRVDDRGLFTRTRYNKTELADHVLETIRDGAISGYSFSGTFRRSNPLTPRGGFRPDRHGNLPTVRRTDSTLREYGPTPFPAYKEAQITGVRAEQITEQLAVITDLLRSGAPLDTSLPSGAPEWDTPPGDTRPLARSDRSVKEEMQAARSAFLQRYRR